jgi:cobalt-zinc-cadmium efflux system outer membrane protein
MQPRIRAFISALAAVVVLAPSGPVSAAQSAGGALPPSGTSAPGGALPSGASPSPSTSPSPATGASPRGREAGPPPGSTTTSGTTGAARPQGPGAGSVAPSPGVAAGTLTPGGGKGAKGGKKGAAPAPTVPAPTVTQPPPPSSPATAPLEENLMQGAQPMSLDAIMRHAKDNAMKVRVARTRVGLGDAAITGAKPLLIDNPQLYLGMGMRFNQFGTNFELQSTLSQPFEIGGERGLRIKAGRRYRELLDKELAQIQWETYAAVHYAYNMALLARARAATAERTLAFSTRLLEIAQRRAQAGEISSLRVRVATGELAQARQAKLNADLEYRLSCIHLSELAGWPQGQVVAPAGNMEAPTRVKDAAEFIAKVQQEHPALKAREAAVDLGEARVKSAHRDRLPEPSLGVYFGREKEPVPNGQVSGDSKLGLVTVTLPIPLWKRNQAARATTQAELSVAEQELEATRYALALNARRAVEAVNTAAERVRTYSNEVVPRFEENLNLLQRAFELGEVDILEVFVARENFLRIQNEALDAFRAYYDAVYNVESMIGAPIQTIAA